jgi:hypothetical protein
MRIAAVGPHSRTVPPDDQPLAVVLDFVDPGGTDDVDADQPCHASRTVRQGRWVFEAKFDGFRAAADTLFVAG